MSFDKDIIFGKIKAQIKKMKNGDTFVIKDLLYGFDEYDTLSKIDKLLVGKIFKNDVKSGNIMNVSLTGDKKNNCIEYKKGN